MVATKIERHAAPLRQQVLRLLREDILEGVLPPGKRMLENSLCENYGVSRTVIREVLRQLESENLVTMLPGHGPIVTLLTEHDIEALYQVRSVLEGLAGELFAIRASKQQATALRCQIETMEKAYLHGTVQSREQSKDEFYRLLLEGAANEVLSEQLHGVHTRIGLLRRFAFVDESGSKPRCASSGGLCRWRRSSEILGKRARRASTTSGRRVNWPSSPTGNGAPRKGGCPKEKLVEPIRVPPAGPSDLSQNETAGLLP